MWDLIRITESQITIRSQHYRRFSFTPIYSPDMPKRLPLSIVFSGFLGTVAHAVRFWLHYTVVAIAWLGVVPLTACRSAQKQHEKPQTRETCSHDIMIRLGILDAKIGEILCSPLHSPPTVGRKNANLHIDSRKPGITDPLLDHGESPNIS